MRERLSQDLRYAFRQWRGHPGFTLVTMLVLALGIGANAAVFSVINAVLLRPLPFPDADRLVQVWESNAAHGRAQDTVSPYDFVDWRRQSASLAELAVYEYESPALATRGAPERMDAAMVSSGFFRVFQTAPQLGRTFSPEDDRPGAQSVVISYRAWQRHFHGDPQIVGQPITLDGQPFQVIGVMPAVFRFPALGIDLWGTPAFDLASKGRGSHFLFCVGRMRPGVAVGQAQMEMRAIARRLEQQYPGTNEGSGVTLVPLQEEMVGGFRRGLYLLWGAVSLVLLIGCANVAHLLVARSVSRQKELAIRTALGAGRARLVRQLLTENAVLAGAGGLLGLALTPWGIQLLLAGGGRIVPRTEAIRIDGPVVLFTSAACLLTAAVFGLLPALRASRVDLSAAVKRSGWDARAGGWYGLRSVLVVSELALSVMLLIGAGLLMKSLWQLWRVDPGFQPANVLGLRISVPQTHYRGSRERAVLYQEIVDRIAALPGVEGAAATNDLPFSGSRTSTSFEIEGLPPVPGESRDADYRVVSSGYFRVMGIPLRNGRYFTEADNRRETPRVVLVNEALVRRYWRDRNPVGQRLLLHDRSYEIVGVVGNVRHADLTAAGAGEIYVPQYQGNTPPWTFLAVRSRTSLGSLIPAVRSALREAAPAEPVYDTRTLEERVARSIAPQRFNALALAMFALFALLLATMGIYGVVAFAVERRTHEMGIRLAVGARPADVLGLMVRQGVRLGLLGVALGVGGALLVSRILGSMLYGTGAGDPLTYLAVAALFLAIATLASYVPARRAARLDPMAALRWE